MKYRFVVVSKVTLGCDVEAESLEDAVALAKSAGVMGLCHQCAGGVDGEWSLRSLSGEIDCDPGDGELEDVYVDDEDTNGENVLVLAKELWA